MHPEIEELRPKLKEILYDCAVDVRATKAALYLYDGSAKFDLVAEYGFRTAARDALDLNAPVIDRSQRSRSPYFINGLTAEPRFSEYLYEASTDRLLAAPIYLRGQLVGLIDMRDKAGKKPFEQPDVPKAQKIADRVAELFANKNVFGQRFIALAEGEAPAAAAQAAPPNTPSAVPAPPQAAAVQGPVAAPSSLHDTVIAEARAAMTRIIVPPAPEALTEMELAAVRDVLRMILLIPGTLVATFTAFGHLGGVQETAARAALTEEALQALQAKLNVWMAKRGEAGGALRSNLHTPPGATAEPISVAQLQKVFTAPVAAGSLRGLYLTVAFADAPERGAHELLAAFHTHLQTAIEQSIARTSLQALRSRVAEKIIEPYFVRHPELKRHVQIVAACAERFARHLALPAAETETVRLVALVHDAGMRLLEYDRLYRKSNLSPDETRLLREHPAVGAALAEPLGRDVARAVLCHHERVDGRGYPNELRGDEIPIAARLVQICDAYVAMTDAQTYQQPIPVEAALGVIASGGGAQFDRDLAQRFVEMARAKG